MTETLRERPVAVGREAFAALLTDPTPQRLWALQKTLLAIGGPDALAAREVAREFHACLRTLESKSASRMASRWGAVLGTAAIGSVSLRELLGPEGRTLEHVIDSAVPAALEVGSALQTAEAWEVEARLAYDGFAWFLDGELWAISVATRPDLANAERRARIDELVDPLLDRTLAEGERAVRLIDLFRSVLAARLLPLLDRRA